MKKTRYVFVTLAPLAFMVIVTFSAGYLKIFSTDPKLGFLSGADWLGQQAAGLSDLEKAQGLVRQAAVWRFDAAMAGFFLSLVALIVIGSARQWYQLIRGRKPAVLTEAEFIPVSRLENAV
jgi:carbon starvation protein